MSIDDRKDLPPVTSPNFLERVREVLSVYLGNRGGNLNRGVTLRDLVDAGMATLDARFAAGGRSAAPLLAEVTASYEPDLTPPPSPGTFTATAAISHILVECDAPTYTQGHGHAKARLYGATWISGALPVFANAVLLTEFQGTVFAYATNPSTIWRLWLGWVTVDGVESLVPAGGSNGLEASTGVDVTKLVLALTGAGKPFTILAEPEVRDGVSYPAGTYTTLAMIMDAQISTAKIKDLAVDNAKIASMSVAKLTAGSLALGQYVQSSVYTPGSAGWRINADGSAELSGVVVRGTLSGSTINGGSINAATMNSGCINLQGDGATGPGYVRSLGKWWGDGSNGWIFCRTGDTGDTFAEIKGGANRIWMSNWNDCGISFPGILITASSAAIGGTVIGPDHIRSDPPTSTANREIPSFLAGRPNEINDLQAIF